MRVFGAIVPNISGLGDGFFIVRSADEQAARADLCAWLQTAGMTYTRALHLSFATDSPIRFVEANTPGCLIVNRF